LAAVLTAVTLGAGPGRDAAGSLELEEADVKPRIKVLTLGVSDLERSLSFYRDGMGLNTKGVVGQEFEDGAVVFFNMNDDLVLALYPTASLSKDARITATEARLGAVAIGHIVESKEEVDAVMKRAEQAGAVITDPPHDRFWGGYSGYFHDPDGHLWEIAWHPQWSVTD
jgi:catechol 2,3-dioxygenase-like lactoylglutathione lyase family enzyme